MDLIKTKKQIAVLLAISSISGIIAPTLLNLNNIESFAYSDIINLSEVEQQSLEIKKIEVSENNIIILKNDGTVWGTGRNDSGILGTGDTIDRNKPVKIPIDNVKDIITGEFHIFFIKENGEIWAIGANKNGQFGNGSENNQLSPIKISITDVKDIITVDISTFFLKNNGRVWATGYNGYGQLGIGNTTSQKTPVLLSITDVKKVIANGNNTFFIKNDGTVWATGLNKYGQLGVGHTSNLTKPVQVPITDVKDIVCGYDYTFFIKNDGTVWATGYNSYGQLGIGNTTNQNTPVQVNITDIKKICAGICHTAFLKNDGSLFMSGGNPQGQLGNGKNFIYLTPSLIINDIKDVYANLFNTVIIKNDNTIWATGKNNYGQLGIGNTIDKASFTQVTSNWTYSADYLISIAEQTKLQSNFDKAQIKVNELLDGQGKTELQNRLNILQIEINNIKIATDLILKVENTLLQNDFNMAQDAINLLPNSEIKTSLQNRLNLIKNQIKNENVDDKYNKQLQDTINKVIKAESSKTNFDIVIAQTAINNLKESDKILLQERLDILKEQIKTEQETLNYNNQLQDATDKVTKAENSKTDYDITVAQALIDKLNPEDKALLQSKLDNLKEQIKLEKEALDYEKLLEDATVKVTKSETTKLNYDITIAKDAINKLKPEDKTPLQDRIDVLEYNILLEDANLKVLSAEEFRTDISISIAQIAVDKVPLREVSTFALELVGKVQLQSKLDTLKLSIEEERYLKLLQEANDNVTNAESTKTLKDIKLAQMSIDRLKENDKSPLQERLDNLKALIAQEEKELQDLKLATSKVEQAEATKTQKYIDEAKILVNQLKESEEKTNLLRRINAIEQQLITDNIKIWIYQAEVYVKQAEALKREPYITKAQTSIDKLPNGTPEKALLQARLDKVK